MFSSSCSWPLLAGGLAGKVIDFKLEPLLFTKTRKHHPFQSPPQKRRTKPEVELMLHSPIDKTEGEGRRRTRNRFGELGCFREIFFWEEEEEKEGKKGGFFKSSKRKQKRESDEKAREIDFLYNMSLWFLSKERRRGRGEGGRERVEHSESSIRCQSRPPNDCDNCKHFWQQTRSEWETGRLRLEINVTQISGWEWVDWFGPSCLVSFSLSFLTIAWIEGICQLPIPEAQAFVLSQKSLVLRLIGHNCVLLQDGCAERPTGILHHRSVIVRHVFGFVEFFAELQFQTGFHIFPNNLNGMITIITRLFMEKADSMADFMGDSISLREKRREMIGCYFLSL